MATTEPGAILYAGRRFGGVVLDDNQIKITELQLLRESAIAAGASISEPGAILQAGRRFAGVVLDDMQTKIVELQLLCEIRDNV